MNSFKRSEYLTQTKEADQGASYASNEYEKYQVANKKAKEDLAATLARHAEERAGLADEREVIKEILRYLGVLADVKVCMCLFSVQCVSK